MSSFVGDLRHAARALRASGGFTVAAVSTMAIAVGATTAMFSIVNAVLIRPLPFSEPDRLLAIGGVREDAPARLRGTSINELRDWREQSRAVEAFGAWRDWSMSRHDGSEGESVYGVIVTPDLFRVLPLQPELGRLFHPDDDRPGNNSIIMLTDAFWRERFGADRGVIGKTMVLERGPKATYSIVGVLPPAFNELPAFEEVQVVALSSIDPDAGTGREIRNRQVFARLRPGASLDEVRTEMSVIASRLARKYPETNAKWNIAVRPLLEQQVGSLGSALRSLFAAVGFLLLIACANIAALQLARALARRREFSIRQAIGGRRVHLARALVAESLLVAILGGAAGLVLAAWLIDGMLAAAPAIPRASDVSLSVPVVLFALAICTAAGLIVALPSSLLTTRLDVVRGLKEESGHAPNVRAQSWRLGFVGAQVAMALVLLTGAVLAAQTFAGVIALGPGFDSAGLGMLSVFNPIDREGGHVVSAYERAIAEARAIPGVRAASAVSAGPLFGGSESMDLRVPGASTSDPPQPARFFNVAPDYFRTLGAPLRRGRDFGKDDRDGAPAVAIVNETFARRYLTGRDPIGARVARARGGDALTIVGVVGDVMQDFRARTPVEPEIYFPYAQATRWATYVVVRADDIEKAMPAVRARIRGMDPELRLGVPMFMTQRIARSARAPRFTMLLLGTFAAVALLLSAVGVYGLVSYSVANRTREIGVRVSLGAQGRDIVRLLARGGLTALLVGCAAGAAGTFLLYRLLGTALPDMDPLRPAAVLLACAGLIAVGALACYVPARRALRIDPVTALRAQ